jgi:hypothetical protein
MTERQGTFTIPTRLYLTLEHRTRLEHLLREQEADLAELVSQIVATYLDALPDTPPAPEPSASHSSDLRQRRTQLAWLRAQRDTSGPHAPAWLGAYIAELEADIRNLEG